MTHPSPEFDALLDSMTEKLCRGELDRADTYFAEARAFGPEAVVCVLAREAATLEALSRVVPRNASPAEASHLGRLREVLGGDYHESHVKLFYSLKNQPPPSRDKAGLRLGERFSLAGSQAVLRGWLGSGGQGEVWAASFVGLDGETKSSTFAIKFEHQRHGPGWAYDADGRVSENQWPQALCFLPGISLSWGDTWVNGRRVVCTEHIDGESLRDRLQRRERFSPRDAARIIERVATTLGCLHALEITHRDMKSANILLDRGDSPWLIDFGLTSGTGKEEDGRGTPVYAAPEKSRSQPQADVFSLGAALFELLSGRAWVAMEDQAAAIEGNPPALGTPHGLMEVLKRCLTIGPESRFRNAMEMAQGLREYLIQDRVQDVGQSQRRPGPVAVLAAKSLPERVALASNLDECRGAVSAGLRQGGISEERFRDATGALICVVRSGAARRIAEEPGGSLTLGDLMQQTPELRSVEGSVGWWAIEEWGWLLGKAWLATPPSQINATYWVYETVLDSVVQFN